MAFVMTNKSKVSSEVLYNSAEHMEVLDAVKALPEDVCEIYKRENGEHAYIMKPVMDMLCFTVPFTGRQQQAECLKRLRNWDSTIPDMNIVKHKIWDKTLVEKTSKHAAYNKNFIVDIHGVKVLLQAQPKTKAHNYLRLTLQPSLMGSEHIKKLWQLMSHISNKIIDTDYICKEGNVTHIDWAIDYLNVPTDDFILLKPGSFRLKKLYISADGMVETDYIQHNMGAKKHKHSKAYIYDKAKHPSLDKKYAASTIPVSRVEFRTYPEHCSFSKFLKMNFKLKNHFQNHEVIDLMAKKENISAPFKAPSTAPPYLWKIFADHLRLRGREIALKSLPTDLSKEYEKILKKQLLQTWDPKGLWRLTPIAVEKFFLILRSG